MSVGSQLVIEGWTVESLRSLLAPGYRVRTASGGTSGTLIRGVVLSTGASPFGSSRDIVERLVSALQAHPACQ